MKGATLRLYNGVSALTNLTGIQALWWDVAEPKDAYEPIGKTSVATTDSNGDIFLDLSVCSGLAINDYGFLMLYQLDGTDHRDSLVFAGKVQITDISSGADMVYLNFGWTKPTDWITLPAVVATDQIFYGAYAVYPHDGNFVTFKATGAYHVNWGDGYSEDVASNTTVYHRILYADVNISTLTSRGYKQALITVTPQSGQTLSVINLTVKHNNAKLTGTKYSSWLQVKFAMNNAGSFTGGGASPAWQHALMESFEWVGTNTQADLSYLFYYHYNLQYVNMYTTSATNMSYMFGQCNKLKVSPVTSCASVTNVTYQYSNCFSLITIPAVSYTGVTSASGFLSSCSALQYVPSTSFPAITGSSAQNIFDSCRIIKNITLSVGSATNISSTFSGCTNLQTINLTTTSSVTTMTNLFSDCFALEYVNAFISSGVTTTNSCFASCRKLSIIPELNLSSVSGFSLFFYNCVSLKDVAVTGIAQTVSFDAAMLGPLALNEIFTNLATVTGKTITVTNNWGTVEAGYDASIATAKGWTVTA